MNRFKNEALIAVIIAIILGLSYYTFSKNEKIKSPSQMQLTTNKAKILYALGAKLGSGFQSENWTPDEAELIAKGFKDATLKTLDQNTLSNLDPGQLQAYLNNRKANQAQLTQISGKEYYNNFVRLGAHTSQTGLAYKVLTEGSGEHPKNINFVEVAYNHKLIDGTPVLSDASHEHPAQIKLDQTILGMSEAIKLMRPGGKMKVLIPPELAFGTNGLPPHIPGGSFLVSEIELLRIVK